MSKEVASYPSLNDKIVLITGGASGIGETIVENFLQQGSRVAFLDKEKDLGNALVQKLNSYEHTALFKHCDLTDISDFQNKIK